MPNRLEHAEDIGYALAFLFLFVLALLLVSGLIVRKKPEIRPIATNLHETLPPMSIKSLAHYLGTEPRIVRMMIPREEMRYGDTDILPRDIVGDIIDESMDG